jgi:hypothetical protein
VTASEFAFLALGLALGAASGAALLEVLRSRPPSRREVRVTVAPNSIPRRSATLAESDPTGDGPARGGPADVARLERTRAELHKLADYYPLRNHLIDFLVTRSRELSLHPEDRPQDRHPPVIRPTAITSTSHAPTTPQSQSPAQAPPLHLASSRVSAA